MLEATDDQQKQEGEWNMMQVHVCKEKSVCELNDSFVACSLQM